MFLKAMHLAGAQNKTSILNTGSAFLPHRHSAGLDAALRPHWSRRWCTPS